MTLDKAPEVARAYRAWLPGRQPWAAGDRQTAPQRETYDTLCSAHQRLAQEGDALELVLATGLLTYLTPEGDRIHHPLLSTRVELVSDAASDESTVWLPEDPQTLLQDGSVLRSTCGTVGRGGAGR